jgi:hypothetical protein
MEDMGFLVTHAYGLTEATGPALACEWKSEWDDAQLSPAQRGVLKGRQGVGVLSLDQVDVNTVIFKFASMRAVLPVAEVSYVT